MHSPDPQDELAEPTANQTFCPPTEEEQQAFLRRHLQYLTKRIHTTKFYPYLIQEEAVDQQDKERIEGGNLTNVGRASELIELIIQRGQQAFVAFMTFLEYDYCKQYEKITGVQARLPPHGWKPSRFSAAACSKLESWMDSLKELMHNEYQKTLQDTLEKQRQKIESSLLEKGQETKREVQNNMLSLEDDLNDYQAKLEITQQEKEKLQEEIKDLKRTLMQLENKVMEQDQTINELTRNVEFHTECVSLEREKSRKLRGTIKTQNASSASATTQQTSDARIQVLIDNERLKYQVEIDALTGEIQSLEATMKLREEGRAKIYMELQDRTQELQKEREQMTVLKDDYQAMQKKTERDVNKQNMFYRELQKKNNELERKIYELEQQRQPRSPEQRHGVHFPLTRQNANS